MISSVYNFTFHDVSINTMFSTGVAIACPLFTFHDVSINTLAVAFADVFSVFFTFHDVSINTENSAQMAAQVAALHSTMFLLIQETVKNGQGISKLYIPRCFY